MCHWVYAGDREAFLTYISPIHYNVLRRKSSLKQLSKSMSGSFKRLSLRGSGRQGSGAIPAIAEDGPLTA